MLTVTDSAKQLLKSTLRGHSDDPEMGLRLSSMSPRELGVKLDREAEGDQVVEYEGIKVLLVAAKLAPLMEWAIIDTKDTTDGPRLSSRRKIPDEWSK